jgi:hypothetical protein
MCFDSSEECATSIFRVTVSLAWIHSDWESYLSHLQTTISQAMYFVASPWGHSWRDFGLCDWEERNASVTWKKIGGNLTRAMGEAEIELATSKWEWVPKTTLLMVNSDVWAVHKQVRHSHLSTCTFATIDHHLEILGASTSCPGLYGDSCTYTFQNNGNILFFPPTSASTRTRFSHPEEGSSKFPETSKNTRTTTQKSNRRPSIDS